MGDMEDRVKAAQFKSATGTALSFESIDGVGPSTAKKLKRLRGVRAPKDIQDMSADELSDKVDGVGPKSARGIIRGAGGNPDVSKRSNSGTVSAAGIKTRAGDFMVDFSDQDKARAKNDPRSRSREAVRQDDRKRAPITTDYDRWKSNMSGLDFPGVDTPTQEPDLLPKDVKQRQRPATTNFEARDESNSRPEGERHRPVPSEEQGLGSDLPRLGVPAGEYELIGQENRESMFSEFGGPTFNHNEGRVRESAPSNENRPPETGLNIDADPYDGQPMPFSSGSDKQLFELSPWTVSKSRTALNKKVYVEEREELDPLREKFTGLTGDSPRPVVLDDEERQEVVGALREDYDMWDGLVQDGRKETLMSRDTTEDRDLVGGALEELGEDIGAGVDDTLSRMDNATKGL